MLHAAVYGTKLRKNKIAAGGLATNGDSRAQQLEGIRLVWVYGLGGGPDPPSFNLNPAVGRLDPPQTSESASDGDRSKWNLKVTISTAPQLQS